MPRFRPAARPVDTSAVNTNFRSTPAPVRPVAPLAPEMPTPPRMPARDNVDQLLSALAALNPQINKLAQSYIEEEQKKDTVDAELRFLQDNVTSWAEAVAKDPTLADRSPIFRQVYEARAAKARVQQRAGELMAEYFTSGIASSENPGDINQWLSTRMKDLLASAQSPAEKQALVEEVQSVSHRFVSAHQENARRNLVMKNRESVSATYQALFDNYAALGPAVPYQTNDPVTKDLDPTKKALLNAIAGGESGGRYNLRWSPKGTALFNDFSKHPRIFEPGPEGPSSAAGRYQITATTWDRIMGPNTPFTPENQDRAAVKLAEADYKARTGRNLWDDLDKEGFSPRIMAALSPTWVALKVNRGRHLATYNASIQKYGKEPRGPGADNAYLPELTEELQKVEMVARRQGMNPAEVNHLSIQAVVAAAIRHQDENILNVALQSRPDGTPGPGMTLEGRKALDEARLNIRRLKIQEQNQAWTLQQREREMRKREVKSVAMTSLLGQMQEGKPPRIPLELVQSAAREDPELGDTLMQVQKNLDDLNKTEDTHLVAQLSARIYSGNGTPYDVFNAVAAGTLKEPSTIRNLMEQAARNNSRTVVTHPVVKPLLDDVRKIVGEESLPGILQRPLEGSAAVQTMTQALLDFEKKNPEASPAELLKFATEQKDLIIKTYRPEQNVDGAKFENVQKENRQAGAVTAPNQQGGGEAVSVDPRPGVEWRKVPLYGDLATFEKEWEAFKGGQVNSITAWVANLRLKPNEVAEFYATQKRMLQNKPKR
ncbi:hypothetical protein [Azorhizobium caulinodans]|nr:hypothetical protein [Azorhizobium caulinodans]